MSLFDELRPLAADALPQLKGARLRLATEEQWTTRSFARSLPENKPVDLNSPMAKCWCIRGAIRAGARKVGVFGYVAGEVFVAAVGNHINWHSQMPIELRADFGGLAIWNDEQATFADVTALLDKSIKLAEAIVDGSRECAMLIDVIPKTEK